MFRFLVWFLTAILHGSWACLRTAGSHQLVKNPYPDIFCICNFKMWSWSLFLYPEKCKKMLLACLIGKKKLS